MKTFEIVLMLTKGFTSAIISAYNLREAIEKINEQYPNAQIVETVTIGRN